MKLFYFVLPCIRDSTGLGLDWDPGYAEFCWIWSGSRL